MKEREGRGGVRTGIGIGMNIGIAKMYGEDRDERKENYKIGN